MSEKSPLIVALDFPVRAELDALVDKLDPSLCRLKVGKELFTLYGPEVVRDLHKRGFEVFLDLKFHDIPNTAAAAVAAAADMGVWMVNVHASGGVKMMSAAKAALLPFGKEAPLLIAVTVLTSMQSDELAAVGVGDNALAQVSRLAALTAECGLDGVVCSAQEVSVLRDIVPDDFLLVTPGIRPEGSERGDQQRVATPTEAVAMGSNYLVIGRPITRSADPLATLRQINASLGY
ncbi:MAG: orotidine-5'-phosphate decarboxylase [Gammaproteobacteria bacterium]|jgi:orotidine-5'-phosphate decarboxylase|nr:orotidine-5'-phosphate decarboxylase [Zhongshania sp.]MBU0538731.1 orotidine-5'-phosphate decarboxylase [Gammaproteobacteria bacterium]MBU1832187.1 orotidine-5'-phosphate decarboxylase [Gammaproteobacteria bacterium]